MAAPGVCDIEARTHGRRSWIIVLCLTALYLLAACAWQGISFYDDSLYLGYGLSFHFERFVHDVFWAPLYSLWISVITLVVHDRVWCYMASWALLVTACCTTPLLFRKRWAWAFTLALVAAPYFNIGPYVSQFVSIILLIGLCCVLQPGITLQGAAFAACMASFLASMCRGEYAYAVYISTAATLLLSLPYLRKGKLRVPATMVGLAVLAAFLIHYFQSHSGNSRPALTFLQHFNVRAIDAGVLKDPDPWTSTYAERLFGLPLKDPVTGKYAGLLDYYRANHSLFLGHIRTNLASVRFWVILLTLMVEVMLPWVSSRYREMRAATVYLFLIAIPVISTMAIIYPRPHYGLVVTPALLAMGLALLGYHVSFAPPRAWQAVAVGAFCIAAEVGLRHNRRHVWDSSLRANVTLVRCIQQAEATVGAGNGRILNAGMPEYADIYFKLSHRRVEPPATYQDFVPWLQMEKPSWIIAGPELAHSLGQQPDALTQSLQGDFGYRIWPCQARLGTRIYTRP